MKKTALLIDGAYLRAVATKHHGLDFADYTADFIEKVALKCVDKEEEELFRIFYYDCLPNKKPQRYPISGREYVSPAEALSKNDLPRKKYFAVRLGGAVHFRGWRRTKWGQREPLDSDYKPNYEQKGVDMRIGLDIATFSYERTVERIILVTGDTDFVPAMKMARRLGLQVVLVQLLKLSRVWSLLPHTDIVREVPLPDKDT